MRIKVRHILCFKVDEFEIKYFDLNDEITLKLIDGEIIKGTIIDLEDDGVYLDTSRGIRCIDINCIKTLLE